MQPALLGDAAPHRRAVATLEEAGDAEISFLSNPKYEKPAPDHTGRRSRPQAGSEGAGRNELVRVSDPYAPSPHDLNLHGYRRHRRVPPSSARRQSTHGEIGECDAPSRRNDR